MRAPAASTAEYAQAVAEGCSALYVEVGCRQAMRAWAKVPVESRAATVAEACRAAYCPLLPAPRPALCQLDWATVTPTRLAAIWPPFLETVHRFDLGDAARLLEAPPDRDAPAASR